MSNKGSDNNVGSIERLKRMVEIIPTCDFPKFQMDYDNALLFANDIKVVLAEREQKDKRIQELEEERQLVGIPVRNKRDGKIGIVLHQWENGSIAVLERINPRIINTHDSWSTLEIITDEVKQVQTQDDTISKQVIIDKIKEVHNMKFEDDRLNGATIDFAVHKFEELLEGEGK